MMYLILLYLLIGFILLAVYSFARGFAGEDPKPYNGLASLAIVLGWSVYLLMFAAHLFALFWHRRGRINSQGDAP